MILAEGTTWTHIGVLIAAFGVIVTVALWWINHAFGQYQTQINNLQNKVDAAETNSQNIVTKLLDERFRSVSHELKNDANHLSLIVGELRKQVEASSVNLSRLSEQDRSIEKAVADKFETLKDFLYQSMANKNDLRGHQEHVEKRMNDFATQLGELKRMINGAKA